MLNPPIKVIQWNFNEELNLSGALHKMEIIVFQVLVAPGLRSQISCTLPRPGIRVSQLTCTAFDYLSAGRYFTSVWQRSFSSPLPVLTLVPGQSIFHVKGYGHPGGLLAGPGLGVGSFLSVPLVCVSSLFRQAYM